MWVSSLFPLVGDAGKKSAKKLARFENNMEWQNTFANLLNLSTYRFNWQGLPDTCNARFLELALITYGQACIAKTEFGLQALFAAPTGLVNVNGEFLKLHAYGWNGFYQEFTNYIPGADNRDAGAVLCRDNSISYPYLSYIIRATERLTSAQRSLDVAAKKLKNPYFIVADQSQKDSVNAVLNDIDENMDRIIVSSGLHTGDFNIFPTHVDAGVLQALWTHYYNLHNAVSTVLGIQTETKQSGDRERLLAMEVELDSVLPDFNIAMRLEQRRDFAKKCNELFGTNISVELRGTPNYKGTDQTTKERDPEPEEEEPENDL